MKKGQINVICPADHIAERMTRLTLNRVAFVFLTESLRNIEKTNIANIFFLFISGMNTIFDKPIMEA